MAAIYYGFNPPFLGGSQNVMSRQEDDRLIKNDILQLLLTVPGDRVMRPGFGMNIRNMVFEQLNAGDIALIQSQIASGIRRHDPRVKVLSVSVVNSEEKHQVAITIIMSLVKDPKRQLTLEQFIDTSTS